MGVNSSLDRILYADAFQRNGYFICDEVLSLDEVENLRAAIGGIQCGDAVRKKQSVYGIRNLLEICPAVRSLAAQRSIRQFVVPILGDRAFAVRAIYFDKVAGEANWSLFWHQDNVIAVARRVDLTGYVGWSQKAGIWQVQPPPEILAGMVAVRIHLDDSGEQNGPLRILPGSHRCGWIDNLDDWKKQVPEVICTVRCGGVVTMCPLILHASSRSQFPGHRRVIHIEYAASDLPDGLDWHTRVGLFLPVADAGNAYCH